MAAKKGLKKTLLLVVKIGVAAGLLTWLGQLRVLGFTGLLLSPTFAAGLLIHLCIFLGLLGLFRLR